MVAFWSIVNTPDGPHVCDRPTSFNSTTKNIVIGITFGILSLLNFTAHTFLISIIFYNWKASFQGIFVYRLILCMSFIAMVNMIVHFVMTIPCSITGCLYYPTWLMELLTLIWLTLEDGFFLSVLFIAIDRFFMFYWRYYGKFFQQMYTIILLWSLTFLSQLILFVLGCPKLYNVIIFGDTPCLDCHILGVSWSETVRTLIYNLPYPMFIIYFLIIVKIIAMRCNFYHANGKFNKNDQVLAIQFFILCGIQYLLSNLENYLHEGPDNYIGLLLLNIPILIQLIHALAPLLTNTVIRRGIKELLNRGSVNAIFFTTPIRAQSSQPRFVYNRNQPWIS